VPPQGDLSKSTTSKDPLSHPVFNLQRFIGSHCGGLKGKKIKLDNHQEGFKYPYHEEQDLLIHNTPIVQRQPDLLKKHITSIIRVEEYTKQVTSRSKQQN
jgi:hypothetical protein